MTVTIFFKQLQEDCTNFAVKMEEHYIKKLTWVDLPYNFFLGNDRLLYEGRGWLFDGAFKSSKAFV